MLAYKLITNLYDYMPYRIRAVAHLSQESRFDSSNYVHIYQKKFALTQMCAYPQHVVIHNTDSERKQKARACGNYNAY